MFDSAAAQSRKVDAADVPRVKRGTNTSFGPLKQIDAGVLNIGYAEARPKGDANGAPHPDPSAYAKKFAGKYTHRNIKGGIGHNLPQEAPQAFAKAVVEVDGY